MENYTSQTTVTAVNSLSDLLVSPSTLDDHASMQAIWWLRKHIDGLLFGLEFVGNRVFDLSETEEHPLTQEDAFNVGLFVENTAQVTQVLTQYLFEIYLNKSLVAEEKH
ncbi:MULTISPECIES: hypothetical protein [unclassified Cedecea]|uniref:hypothetical protein n=1 Tax=unclassified Cedecea TaxID=2649846 RepID=UPI00301A6FC0